MVLCCESLASAPEQPPSSYAPPTSTAGAHEGATASAAAALDVAASDALDGMVFCVAGCVARVRRSGGEAVLRKDDDDDERQRQLAAGCCTSAVLIRACILLPQVLDPRDQREAEGTHREARRADHAAGALCSRRTLLTVTTPYAYRCALRPVPKAWQARLRHSHRPDPHLHPSDES